MREHKHVPLNLQLTHRQEVLAFYCPDLSPEALFSVHILYIHLYMRLSMIYSHLSFFIIFKYHGKNGQWKH